MALTFTSWTAYTDDDGNPQTLDWTDPTGCLTRAHYEAVLRAFFERNIATGGVGGSVPTLLNTPLLYTQTTILSLGIPIMLLLPVPGPPYPSGFVVSDIDPYPWVAWRMANILADIGDPVFISPLKYSPCTGGWVKQSYEILRRLRWNYWGGAALRDWWTWGGTQFVFQGS